MENEEIVANSDKYKDKRVLNILPHQYKKGQSGNPAGKPKGAKSMKTYVKERLETMSDEEREIFLEGIDKKILWEMSEGKAKQDVSVEGEVQMLVKIDE